MFYNLRDRFQKIVFNFKTVFIVRYFNQNVFLSSPTTKQSLYKTRKAKLCSMWN